MNLNDLLHLDEAYQMPQGPRLPIAPIRGEGSFLYDSEGKAYLDFSSGMGNTCIGHSNSAWSEAIFEQTLNLGCSVFPLYQERTLRLAEELCCRSGMASACFTSSGREATRLMLMLARRYSQSRHGGERTKILSLSPSLPPSFEQVVPISAHMDSVRAAASSEVCAVLVELVPMQGDMDPLPRHFVHELAVYCAEQDWLLLVEEGQTAGGRCGSLFSFLQYGFLPDLLSFSELLSGGLPFGGILSGNRCRLLLEDGTGEVTLGANPVSAAAALAVLELLNEDLLAQAKEKGNYLRQGIEALCLPSQPQIRGTGLMIGLSFGETQNPHTLILRLAELGLLAMEMEQGVLFLPPLTVKNSELDRSLQILQQALGEGV